MRIGKGAQKAFLLGLLCALSYFAVYFARNVLGAVTPMMLKDGFDEAFIGNLSSVYFVTYAVGQLINGILGDKIPAKYMIALGLLLAGGSNALFLFVARTPFWALAAYAVSGFFLAMIYGPMSKLVAENTEPVYATRCGLGYTFASFFASPLAGIFAATVAWQGVFGVGIGLMALMSAMIFISFTVLERRGVISYGKYRARKEEGGSVRVLLRHGIVKFSAISLLTGVVRTSVVFWMPTYYAQRLGFPEEKATLLFSISTFAISLTAFAAVFLFERLRRNIGRTILVLFLSAAFFFTLVYFVRTPAANVALLTVGIMSSNGAATILWNAYCPSLRDTGMVSKATGFLDFLSYIGAAISSRLFAGAATTIGWDSLVLVWLGLMLAGVLISLPYGKLFRRKKEISP